MKITITQVLDRVKLLYVLRVYLIDDGLTLKQLT